MCGIIGQLSSTSSYEIVLKLSNSKAQPSLAGSGFWNDQASCTLGFQPMDVSDYSLNCPQPIHSSDRRYVIVMNGELYNTQTIRNELQKNGCILRSTEAGEVALYALAQWGRKALERFNGSFSLAFYDRVEKSLLLAQDHVGSKPLYYIKNKEGLFFSSFYDRILAHPWARGLEIDQSALSLYLRFGYIPAPFAILKNTCSLEPGSWLEVDASGNFLKGRFFEFPVYQEPDLYGEQAYEAVEASLQAAVRRRVVGEAPIGCLLSGGVDSPLITALAQSLHDQPIQAFTIGNENPEMDESEDAAIYAKEIGVEHQIQRIQFDDVEALVMEAAQTCSEPFGDYSIIPTLLVSKFASNQVKAILSGDGGDELFWGYTGRMGNAIKFSHLFKSPFWMRKLRWWFLHRPNEWNPRYFKTIGEWYQATHEHNFEYWLKDLLPGIGAITEDYIQYHYNGCQPDQTAQWVRWNEFTGHMGNGLLKMERASAYHSLWVRTPILDREVIATALRVDWRSCLDLEEGQGKKPLRRALEKKVQYQTKNKRGFTVPMGDWLKGPLRNVYQDLVLDRKELLGLEINRRHMRQVFQDHLDGRTERSWGLWIFLSLALWEATHYKK